MNGINTGTLLCALILTATAAKAQTDVERGRTLAQQQCARCHVIGDFNPNGGIGSTPSFQLLVNALKDHEQRFKTFFARRPHGAFVTVKGYPRLNKLPDNAAPIEITYEQVEELLAFARTLKKK